MTSEELIMQFARAKVREIKQDEINLKALHAEDDAKRRKAK